MLVLNCWLTGLDYVDCFRRLHQICNLHREHAHWRQIWERLEDTDRLSAPRRESRRPQGRPERLLVGWFHHL